MSYEDVKIVWNWKDVQALRPEWDETRCKEALCVREIVKHLEEQSVLFGWDVLEALLSNFVPDDVMNRPSVTPCTISGGLS